MSLEAWHALARQENEAMRAVCFDENHAANNGNVGKPSPAVAARRAKVAEMRDGGMSVRDIAAELGKPVGTIKSDLSCVRAAKEAGTC